MRSKRAKICHRSERRLVIVASKDLSSEDAPRVGRNWPNIEDERTACKVEMDERSSVSTGGEAVAPGARRECVARRVKIEGRKNVSRRTENV